MNLWERAVRSKLDLELEEGKQENTPACFAADQPWLDSSLWLLIVFPGPEQE